MFISWGIVSQFQLFFYSYLYIFLSGDGQVDFDEFMTILGPKLVSSEGRDGFLGNTIDSIFWQVRIFFFFFKIKLDSKHVFETNFKL